MKREVIYFDKEGKENTKECLAVVEKIADSYQDIVVASSSGKTGLLFAEKLGKKNLVVVTLSHGLWDPNKSEISGETRKKITELGGRVFTGTTLTSSLERGFAEKYQGTYPSMIIADTLRTLGQGIKVCAEIVMEACDAGLIEEGKDVIAVAGTHGGSDTVCIIKSAASKRFLDLKIKEILAKPREF